MESEWPHCDDDVGAARTGTSCAKSDEQHADREVSDAAAADGDAGGGESSAAAAAEEGPVMLPSPPWLCEGIGRSEFGVGLVLLQLCNSTQLNSRLVEFQGCAASRGFCSLSGFPYKFKRPKCRHERWKDAFLSRVSLARSRHGALARPIDKRPLFHTKALFSNDEKKMTVQHFHRYRYRYQGRTTTGQ